MSAQAEDVRRRARELKIAGAIYLRQLMERDLTKRRLFLIAGKRCFNPDKADYSLSTLR